MYSFAHIFIYMNYIFMTKILLNFHKKLQVSSTRFNSGLRLVKGAVSSRFYLFILSLCVMHAEVRGQLVGVGSPTPWWFRTQVIRFGGLMVPILPKPFTGPRKVSIVLSFTVVFSETLLHIFKDSYLKCTTSTTSH